MSRFLSFFVADFWAEVVGKILLNILEDLLVCYYLVWTTHLLDSGLAVDEKYLLHWKTCVVIGNRVVLPVSQTSYKRIHCEQTAKDVHGIGFDVSCFLGYFVVYCVCKLLWLCHDGSIYFTHILQIFFGVIV